MSNLGDGLSREQLSRFLDEEGIRYFEALHRDVKLLLSNIGQVGDVKMVKGSVPPKWLELNGAILNYNDYPTLGALYGATPGTTFTLETRTDVNYTYIIKALL